MNTGIAGKIKSRLSRGREEGIQKVMDSGVVHGRFQILHLKQMEYILAAKMRCQKLYIGITHPDIVTSAASSELDLHGTGRRDNPMTYFERFEMVHDALLDFGVERHEFEILPFPISHPGLLLQYVPKDAVYYMSICSDWDEEKKRILNTLGLQTEVLWTRSQEERGITGTKIRELIAEGKEWKQYVPKTAVEYAEAHGIVERIQKLYHR